MTEEEVKKITDACDIICANCERKYEHAYACDSCVVNEVGDNAINKCIDELESESDDDEDTDVSNFIDPDYEDYDSSCGV